MQLTQAQKLKEAADERMNELQETSDQLKALQARLPEFYLGQGAVYVLENRNMIFKNQMLVPNGPGFTTHAWNTRQTSPSKVETFYKLTNNGKLLEPMQQEHALYFAVSPSLVNRGCLKPVHSGEFPAVEFNSDVGTVLVAGGHHRIAVLEKTNSDSLQLKTQWSKIIDKPNKKDSSSELIAEARRELEQVHQNLWARGRWGVIFLNLGWWSCRCLFS